MNEVNYSGESIGKLVDEFASIAVLQGAALEDFDTRSYNRLFSRLMSVVEELKRRKGDQRRALTSLYTHKNMQVRLLAAQSSIAVAPQAAREVLHAIADSGHPPQALHAGMALFALDQGISRPE